VGFSFTAQMTTLTPAHALAVCRVLPLLLVKLLSHLVFFFNVVALRVARECRIFLSPFFLSFGPALNSSFRRLLIGFVLLWWGPYPMVKFLGSFCIPLEFPSGLCVLFPDSPPQQLADVSFCRLLTKTGSPPFFFFRLPRPPFEYFLNRVFARRCGVLFQLQIRKIRRGFIFCRFFIERGRVFFPVIKRIVFFF